MHALIVGPRNAGKHTLIRRIIQELDRPVFGFESKKEDTLADTEHGSPIYLYEAGTPHQQTPENLVGYCKNHQFHTIVSGFDRFAPKLRAPIPQNAIVVLDEIGFMESQSELFCRAILSLLDGDTPVIASVKNKDFPFLDTVKAHPKAQCFYVTADNWAQQYPAILEFMQAQLEET